VRVVCRKARYARRKISRTERIFGVQADLTQPRLGRRTHTPAALLVAEHCSRASFDIHRSPYRSTISHQVELLLIILSSNSKLLIWPRPNLHGTKSTRKSTQIYTALDRVHARCHNRHLPKQHISCELETRINEEARWLMIPKKMIRFIKPN
jgi:hypothetical protein